jgi:signal transduction histidine kinase
MRSNPTDFRRKRFGSTPASPLSHEDVPEAWMFQNTARWNPRTQAAGPTACNDEERQHPSDLSGTVDNELIFLPAIADALCQAHKIKVMGQMADGLAHRFNNLLQGVLSAMNLMQSRNRPENSGDLEFLICHAFTSVKGVGTLTQRLLEFARPQRPEARAIDANATIVRLQDLLRCALLPGLELKIELGAGPMETICDSHQLENTLLDLVLNARDAMPGGGILTVKTEHADLLLERAGLPPGRYVSICVDDTGVGMSPDALKRVFDPFYTTKTTGHRIGLGLPLAELFAERFQGHIGIDSAIGRGTQVRLYLPCRPI